MLDTADIRPSVVSAIVFILMWLTLVPLVKFLSTKYQHVVPESVQTLISMA